MGRRKRDLMAVVLDHVLHGTPWPPVVETVVRVRAGRRGEDRRPRKQAALEPVWALADRLYPDETPGLKAAMVEHLLGEVHGWRRELWTKEGHRRARWLLMSRLGVEAIGRMSRLELAIAAVEETERGGRYVRERLAAKAATDRGSLVLTDASSDPCTPTGPRPESN
jgi:hypothetical protein